MGATASYLNIQLHIDIINYYFNKGLMYDNINFQSKRFFEFSTLNIFMLLSSFYVKTSVFQRALFFININFYWTIWCIKYVLNMHIKRRFISFKLFTRSIFFYLRWCVLTNLNTFTYAVNTIQQRCFAFMFNMYITSKSIS